MTPRLLSRIDDVSIEGVIAPAVVIQVSSSQIQLVHPCMHMMIVLFFSLFINVSHITVFLVAMHSNIITLDWLVWVFNLEEYLINLHSV